MAVKKAVAAKKAPAKRAPARKAQAAGLAKGESLVCELCGLEVVVDEACGCAEAHEIICCGEPMTEKKPRAKAKAK